jgi:hypothetical protein
MNVTLTKDNIIHGSFWPIGSVVDVSDEEAHKLIEWKEATPIILPSSKLEEQLPVPKKKVDK